MKQILIGKKKNLMFSLKLVSMSAMLLASSLSISFAATGDILYQNCASGGCTGAGSSGGWNRTVVSSGCYSGQCLKLVGTQNPNTGLYGAGNTSISTSSIAGKHEITVSWWVKLSKDASSLSGGNLKDNRIYVGSTQFWASGISPHFGKDYYIDRVIGTVRPASWFNMITSSDHNDYPRDNGDGTYYSWNGYTRGTIQSGGPTGPGTTWVHLTKWVKLPSTPTGSDGAVKVWLGDKLMLDMYNAKMKDSGSTSSFTKMSFYPSSEATQPFEHWVDEMVVYEGYVPPSGAAVAASPPPSTNITPSPPADFKAGS